MRKNLQSFLTLCVQADQLNYVLDLIPRLDPPTCQINNFLLHLPFRFQHQPSYPDCPVLCPVECGSRKGMVPASAEWQTAYALCPPPLLTWQPFTALSKLPISHHCQRPGLRLLWSKTVLNENNKSASTKVWKQLKLQIDTLKKNSTIHHRADLTWSLCSTRVSAEEAHWTVVNYIWCSICVNSILLHTADLQQRDFHWTDQKKTHSITYVWKWIY